jgi:hypothetical protein
MAKKTRQKAQRMASRGASAKEIRQATGIKAPAARNIVARASAPSSTPTSTPTPARTLPEAKSLGQGLRIAGGGYGIGGKELNTIAGLGKDKVKVSPDKVIRKLDKINTKLAEGDKTGISLKSGAVNKLIRKTSKLNPFERSQLNFGTGRLGMQIQSMLGDPGSPAVWRKGQQVGGRAAVEPTFLAKGMDLGPKGREQVRGIGKQYEVPARLMGTEALAEEATANDTEVGGTTAEETASVEPIIPEEKIDNSLSSGAGGLDLASWATGFRRARSSRQKAGRGAQGLASQKKSPFTSWFK